MMGETDQIEWRNMLVAVPAFMTIVVQPFTFSIANGIYAGLLMSALVYILTGTFIEAGRDMINNLRHGTGGIDMGAAVQGAGEGGAVDELDATEAAAAGVVAGKDDGTGLEAPLLPNSRGGSASDLASLHSSAQARASDAISISHQRGSRDSAAGSLSRSHPYERGSFSMLILTHGSQQPHGHLASAAHGGVGLFGSPMQHHSPGMGGSGNASTDDHH